MNILTISLPLIILIGVLILIGGWLISLYNMLITGRNRVKEGWSDIEVQLKRRYDLIPNIINAVKGYAQHEDRVFTQVTTARASAMQAQTPTSHAAAEAQLSQSLLSLMAVAEAYPALKANENFQHLQSELVDTEDKIQASRRFYNSLVRKFNTRVEVFPTNLVANLLGFKQYDFYDGPDEIHTPPTVSF
ncbi:MAG: LemA family protein [Patescibacteria group bacterium]|mgnify:FL=1